jgi:hypothetical protein
MEIFGKDPLLTKTIPEAAAKLMYKQFALEFSTPDILPITFSTGWVEILKFVSQQEHQSFSMDVCGVSIEYQTEYSETDKCTNITPNMIHNKQMVFTTEQIQMVPGSKIDDAMLSRFNSWRTANLTETQDKVERDIRQVLWTDFGINLPNAACVLPIMAAVYTVGVELARDRKQTINMYNIFEIDNLEGDHIVLTPLSIIKQYLKDDTKK